MTAADSKKADATNSEATKPEAFRIDVVAAERLILAAMPDFQTVFGIIRSFSHFRT